MKLVFKIFMLFFPFYQINPLIAKDLDSITPIEAKKLMDSSQAIVIDVREVNELLHGTIEGSLNIPMSLMDNNEPMFKKKIALLPLDKTIIVFCRSGRRSGIVGTVLQNHGYKVLNLGGFEDWKKFTNPSRAK